MPPLTTERLECAVLFAMDKMGVSLSRDPDIQLRSPWIPFNEQALNPVTRSIWLCPKENHTEAWFWALHELEHLVFWRDDDPRMKTTPENLFSPWGVGVLKASCIPAIEYMRSSYNLDTAIGLLSYDKRVKIGDWKHPFKSAWYRRAFSANVASGTIDEKGFPTWRMPDWDKINIKEHFVN